MRRLICISTGCLFNPYLKEDINKEVRLLSKLKIDGVEFLIGDAIELLPFKLKKDTIKILKNFEFNTIHVPFILDGEKLFLSNNKRSKRIMNKIYEIYDNINAVNINLHPHQIKSFKIFDIKNYQYSIENMEMHHEFGIKYYRNILKKNPSFKFILDTTHASEGGELNNLFKAFKKKIIYTHLSANYFNHLHIPLHALNKEYLKPFEIIKKGKFPIVLENQIGTRDITEYKKEIEFVRRWLNS
ncbi:hypothetical protein KY342_05675 [Candidatus Woesearchaeota archaeon]|nr:hypothetical protein [Candidatus Woesearchaeota archaeon]